MYTLAVIANPANNITIRAAWDRVVRADEPDKYTVVLHLKTPYAPLASRFFSSSGLSCVLPKHALRNNTAINDAALLSLGGGVLADERFDNGCDYAAPKGFNDSQYCNRRVDALMQAYVESYEPAKRRALARRFQRLIDDDAPAIVLYERSFAYPHVLGVTGFVPSTFGPFDDFLDVDVR